MDSGYWGWGGGGALRPWPWRAFDKTFEWNEHENIYRGCLGKNIWQKTRWPSLQFFSLPKVRNIQFACSWLKRRFCQSCRNKADFLNTCPEHETNGMEMCFASDQMSNICCSNGMSRCCFTSRYMPVTVPYFCSFINDHPVTELSGLMYEKLQRHEAEPD